MSHAGRSLRSIANHDGAAILDIDRGTITTLNATGAFVWQELGRGQTTDAIITALAERTGESIPTIASDVRDFIEDLASRDLLGSGDDRS